MMLQPCTLGFLNCLFTWSQRLTIICLRLSSLYYWFNKWIKQSQMTSITVQTLEILQSYACIQIAKCLNSVYFKHDILVCFTQSSHPVTYTSTTNKESVFAWTCCIMSLDNFQVLEVISSPIPMSYMYVA